MCEQRTVLTIGAVIADLVEQANVWTILKVLVWVCLCRRKHL